MSRRRASRRGTTARARGQPPRPTQGRAARLAGVLLALAAIAIALAVLRARPGWRMRSRPAPTALSGPDTVARLGPDEAYARAVALVKARRARESLAYFRHALSRPGAPMEAHVDYSTGLINAALESRTRFGLPGPAMRSSIERQALMRESLAQLELAESLATTPAQRALVHASFAHHFVTWGFPWEALLQFREAQHADPSSSWAPIGDVLAARLHHPERPEPDVTLLDAPP